MINIYPIFYNKKQYLDLLLLADEQESMIDRYLERGDMFVLADNNEVKASCVITKVLLFIRSSSARGMGKS